MSGGAAKSILFDPEKHLPVIREVLGCHEVDTPVGKALYLGLTAETNPFAVYGVVLEMPKRQHAPIDLLRYVVGVGKPPLVFTALEEAFNRLGLAAEGELRDWQIVRYNIAYYGQEAFNTRLSYAALREKLLLRREFGGVTKSVGTNMASESSCKRYVCAIDVNDQLSEKNRLGKDFFMRRKKGEQQQKNEVDPNLSPSMVESALLQADKVTEEMQVDE